MLKQIVAGVDGRPGGADAAALVAALAGPDTDVMLVGVYRDPLLPLPITFGRGDELRTRSDSGTRSSRGAAPRSSSSSPRPPRTVAARPRRATGIRPTSSPTLPRQPTCS